MPANQGLRPYDMFLRGAQRQDCVSSGFADRAKTNARDFCLARDKCDPRYTLPEYMKRYLDEIEKELRHPTPSRREQLSSATREAVGAISA